MIHPTAAFKREWNQTSIKYVARGPTHVTAKEMLHKQSLLLVSSLFSLTEEIWWDSVKILVRATLLIFACFSSFQNPCQIIAKNIFQSLPQCTLLEVFLLLSMWSLQKWKELMTRRRHAAGKEGNNLKFRACFGKCHGWSEVQAQHVVNELQMQNCSCGLLKA